MLYVFGAYVSFLWLGESCCLVRISELLCTLHPLEPFRIRPLLLGIPVLNLKWLSISFVCS